MADVQEIFDRLLETLSAKPLTLYQLVYATKVSARTVKKYLALIEKIQSAPKMKKEIRGARVFYLKEN